MAFAPRAAEAAATTARSPPSRTRTRRSAPGFGPRATIAVLPLLLRFGRRGPGDEGQSNHVPRVVQTHAPPLNTAPAPDSVPPHQITGRGALSPTAQSVRPGGREKRDGARAHPDRLRSPHRQAPRGACPAVRRVG